MNILAILLIVVVLLVIVVFAYNSLDSTTTLSHLHVYTTSVNKVILYSGTSMPYISSNETDTIIVAHSGSIDVFNLDGIKQRTISKVGITGVAYNNISNYFMLRDMNSLLYNFDYLTGDITNIGTGCTTLYDTSGGYYAVIDGSAIVVGASSSIVPVNGAYGMISIVTTRS